MVKWTCVVAAGLTGTAAGGIINVPGDFVEIGQAIIAASNGDEIVVAPGTHAGFSFDSKTVTVRSSHGAMKTTLTSMGGNVVLIQGGLGPDQILDGFSIVAVGGRPIHVNSASPTIRNCLISNAIESGLRILNASPTVINCIFVGNSAEVYGGAVYITSGSSPTFVGCTFIGNSADLGGAISNYGDPDAVTTIINSVFVGNEAIFGGAILNGEGLSWMVLSNCTIASNLAALGGGIVNNDLSVLTIQNSIFWGNSSQQIVSDDLAITNVSYSTVDGTWPGIGNIDADPLFVAASDCCIVSPFWQPGCSDPACESAVCDIDPECCDTWWYFGCVELAADLCSICPNDYRLSPGSPCIDTGDNTAVPKGVLRDLDGNPRFAADKNDFDPGCGIPVVVDMGAYEFQGDPFAVRLGDIDGDGIVGINDFLDLLGEWGSCTEACCLADLDLDETVGIADFLLLLGNWG